MTDSMIDRLARVIAPAAFSDGHSSKVTQAAELARARANARELLLAIRAPTDEMKEAGAKLFDPEEGIGARAAEIVFHDMIDAALKE